MIKILTLLFPNRLIYLLIYVLISEFFSSPNYFLLETIRKELLNLSGNYLLSIHLCLLLGIISFLVLDKLIVDKLKVLLDRNLNVKLRPPHYTPWKQVLAISYWFLDG